MTQRLKHLPPVRKTRVPSLGRDDPLEKEMATHSSILAWRIPWKEELGRLQSTVSQRVRHLSFCVIDIHLFVCVNLCASIFLLVYKQKYEQLFPLLDEFM